MDTDGHKSGGELEPGDLNKKVGENGEQSFCV